MDVESAMGIIPARTKHQAMDWSLALASQGIESTILGPEEEQGYRLVVRRDDYGKAVRVLRQYHVENHRPIWQQELRGTGLVFDASAVVWVLIWVFLFILERNGWDRLRELGIMDTSAVSRGEWWRLFTAITLHGDVAHLAANVGSGLVLLGLALGSFGGGWGVGACILAGAIGNLAGWILYTEPHLSLGASGMVMGALGLLTVDSLAHARRSGRTGSLAVRGLFGGIMLMVLLGLNPESHVVAHVGGFLGGAILGLAMSFLPIQWLASRFWNLAWQTASALLLVLSWWLALRS